jgi:exodeoxyribonuclease VIII
LDPEREIKEPTLALIDGRILHCAILEPDKFNSRFVVVPEDAPRRPTAAQYKAANPSEGSIRSMLYWDEFNLQHGDKTVIKYDKQVKYKKIAHAIRTHPELTGFMAGALTEQTFIAIDPETGAGVRCRSDVIVKLDNLNVAIDLKSCEDARPWPFRRACRNYGYWHQDAFYRDVIEWSGWGKLDLFLFAAFEKEPPYALRLYQSTDEAISRARAIYRRSLNTAAACLESGVWPAYDTDIEVLDYPAWVRD